MKKRKLQKRKYFLIGISIIIFLLFIIILVNLNFFEFNFLKTNLEKSGFGSTGPLSIGRVSANQLVAYYSFEGNVNDMSGNENNGIINNLIGYEYTTTHLISSKNAVDCGIKANPGNGFILDSRQCILISGKNCISDLCLWKRKSSTNYEYTTSHAGSGAGENIDCRISANPGNEFILDSRQCFIERNKNCISDFCLWKRKSSTNYEYTTSHAGSGARENIDCRISANPGNGFVIDSRQCISSSGANCLSDICLWKKQGNLVSFVSGKKGQAIKFDGNNYLSLSNLPLSTNPGENTTIIFWMKWDGNNFAMPFGFNGYDLFFYSDSFGFNSGRGDLWGMSNGNFVNNWVHVAAIFYNGDAKKSRLFINAAEQKLSVRLGSPGSASVSKELFISGWDNSPFYKFIGAIDEVRIWNSALSDLEVANDFLGCVPSCSGKQCGDDGCGRSCGGCVDGESCVNGNCVNQFNAEISIATLKDFYSINEEIKLTDPPEEYTSGHISGNAVNDLSSIKYKGYVIEFQDEPIAVKENELEESKDETAPAKSQAVVVNAGSYKTQLISRREAIKNKIKDALGKNKIVPVTANAISDSNDLKILNEWNNVFNGILLNISSEEAEKIKNVSGVKSVVPNLEVQMNLMNSVPIIGADKVWKLDSDGNNCAQSGKECLTGKGMRIGIIDSGVDYTHADLGGCFGINCKVIGGYDFVNSDGDPMDDNGHGTHVAGIAAGSGAGGLKGVAPDAKIYAYKVLDNKGGGYMSDVISAIEKSIDPNSDGNFNDKLDSVSLSLGADCKGIYNNNCGPDDFNSRAIDNAVNSGIVVVTAAGNKGPGLKTIGSPGTSRKAITVGAYHKSNLVADFSSRGPVEWTDANGISQSLIKPDIVTPGVGICSASWSGKTGNCFDSKHISYSGTSMAVPHVAGAAALLKQKNPDWTPEQIKQTLKDTAINLGYDANVQGSGIIDLFRAIEVKPVQKPQSKIVNKGNKILSGQLKISLQKNVGGTWNEITSSEKTISIPANGILKLDNGKDNLGNQIFEGFNNLGIRASSAGNFRVYVKFESSGKFVESNWEFGVV